MSYTEVLLIGIHEEDLRPAASPRSGCRPAWIRFYRSPLRLAMSTTRRIVPATLP